MKIDVRIALTSIALLLACAIAGGQDSRDEGTMKKLTPVLFVEKIEPALSLREERLGFARTVEVPQGDGLGFVILEKDGIEVMYQTRASMAADVPAVAETQPIGGAFLYIEVDDLDAVDRALEGLQRVIPRRRTAYGAEEIIIREPGGNIVAFAQFGG